MSNIKTIQIGSTEYGLEAELAKSITYAELKALRDAGTLTAGCWYRITDYQCTTSKAGTTSAGNQFDIIVVADDASTLNEVAHAIQHDGDTYFADCDLNAWELKYCLDNDTDRFDWADSTNGKGVIYYMKDEFANEMPYDFKNIQFYRSYDESVGIFSTINSDTTGVACYTFSNAMTSSSTLSTDTSLVGSNNVCNNIALDYINEQKRYLNNNCFFGNGCCNNTFGSNCYNNTLGASGYNTFGSNCFNNIFALNCYNNIFDNSCFRNTFYNYCNNNTFGSSCSDNKFGFTCNRNMLGNNCYSNIFGDNCYSNTFGNYCYSNTFGSYCNRNMLGSNCYFNTFGTSSSTKSYCRYITIESGVQYTYIDCTATTSSANYFQNVHINSGVCGTSSSLKTITIATAGNSYLTTVGTANDTTINV